LAADHGAAARRGAVPRHQAAGGSLMIVAIYARKSADQIGAGSEAIAEPPRRT
jgi:hypothetical protein